MELVSDRWYRDLGRAITGLSVLLMVASLVTVFVPAFVSTGQKLGLGVVNFIISTLILLYMLLLHPLILRRVGRYGTTMVILFLLVLNVINLVHSTGELNSWYQIAWIVVLFVSGIFGPYAIFGMVFLMTAYVIVLVADSHHSLVWNIPTAMTLAGSAVMAVISYFFWQQQYMGQEKTQLAKLSGQLNSHKQQSEVLINSIADGIILTDNGLKINLINPAAANMLGWPPNEAIGLSIDGVIDLKQEDDKPLPPTLSPFHQVLSKQEKVESVLKLHSKDGRVITISIVVTPVKLPKKQQIIGAVAVIRDISLSRAEEQRRADFISTASHEMRTPVAAIEGYLALALNDKVSQIDSSARSYLEKAHSSTQQLGKLFQDLLTSAKAEDGRLVNHPVVVEMTAFTEQLVDSLRFTAEKKGLQVDFTIGSENRSLHQVVGAKVVRPLYYAKVDPDRMREVLTNLFDNAVKYTDSGRISIGLTGNQDVVQLYVRDTGPGVPPDDVPHLFQKFYRVDNSATRTIGGTGLGLFISRKIVELYNGNIWVESELKKGSTFYINLPRLDTQKALEMQKAETPISPLGTPSNNLTEVIKS